MWSHDVIFHSILIWLAKVSWYRLLRWSHDTSYLTDCPFSINSIKLLYTQEKFIVTSQFSPELSEYQMQSDFQLTFRHFKSESDRKKPLGWKIALCDCTLIVTSDSDLQYRLHQTNCNDLLHLHLLWTLTIIVGDPG